MPSLFANLLVEPGRVVVVNHGPAAGKVAVIVDILDQNRCLIDGPTSGFPRAIMNYKDLSLTKIVLTGLARGATTQQVEAAAKEQKLQDSWNATTLAQSFAKKAKRATLTDFERFTVSQLKKQRSALMKAAVSKATEEYNTKNKASIEKAKKSTKLHSIRSAIRSRKNLSVMHKKRSAKGAAAKKQTAK